MTTGRSVPPNRHFIMLATGDGAELYPLALPVAPFVPPCACRHVCLAPPSGPATLIATQTEHITTSTRTRARLSTSTHGQFLQ